MEVITQTQHKATLADDQQQQIKDLTSKMQMMQTQMHNMKDQLLKQQKKVNDQNKMQEEQFVYINKFVSQVQSKDSNTQDYKDDIQEL